MNFEFSGSKNKGFKLNSKVKAEPNAVFVIYLSHQNACLIGRHLHIILGSANWISDWDYEFREINFTATMHQLFPVRDTEAVLFSKLIIHSQSTNASVVESIDLLSHCTLLS